MLEVYAVLNKNKEYFEISGLWTKELNLNCLFSNYQALKALNLNGEIITFGLTKKRKTKT